MRESAKRPQYAILADRRLIPDTTVRHASHAQAAQHDARQDAAHILSYLFTIKQPHQIPFNTLFIKNKITPSSSSLKTLIEFLFLSSQILIKKKKNPNNHHHHDHHHHLKP